VLDFGVLAAAAFLAGFIDAVVGGGGLIQLPALFSVMPQTQPATLLGTNKLASIWGTGAAAISFARQVKVQWSTAVPAATAAFIFAFAGAYTVTHVPSDVLRKLLPFILIAVAVYTFSRKDFGRHHAPQHAGTRERVFAVLVGASIGFYDGFFGPGTGSFLVFLFVRFFGFDFLGASAVAKVVNVACNLAALLWFGYSGHVLIQLGILMAVCNIAGSLIGVRLAIRHGTLFVRKIFLFVVSLLILKTGFDAYFAG
jgi:uncharacterized membrane protein YfcA